jgi:hypothetical protein
MRPERTWNVRTGSAARRIADVVRVREDVFGGGCGGAFSPAREWPSALLPFGPGLEVLKVWGAKTLFTPRDHPDLQAQPSADGPHG